MNQFCKGYKYVKKWEGTTGGGGLMHVYESNSKSINVLKQYNGFYSYDNQMDIAFFSKGLAVLSVIAHENEIYGIMDYWKPFFIKEKSKGVDYVVTTHTIDGFFDEQEKTRKLLKD